MRFMPTAVVALFMACGLAALPAGLCSAQQDEKEEKRQAVARDQSVKNLRMIVIAMHNYHDTYKRLPFHAIYDKDGKTPLLSWRVAILPFIEEGPLYNEFKLDEPWDSRHNRQLINKMPKIYASVVKDPKGEKGEGVTHYQVFTGPDTVFDGAKKMGVANITDGLSNTFMVVEAKEPVLWTRPSDLEFPKEKDRLPGLGGLFKEGFHVAFCDGSVRFLSHDNPVATLRALVTPRGGEPVDTTQLK
jgi:prepilin-type processing-associated H-X9-DG protein